MIVADETTEASAAAVSPLPLPRRADEGWIAGATHSRGPIEPARPISLAPPVSPVGYSSAAPPSPGGRHEVAAAASNDLQPAGALTDAAPALDAETSPNRASALPPVAPRAPAALSARQAAYLALIRERAESGGPTPGGDDFRKATGAHDSYRTVVERALVARGLIVVHGRCQTKVYEIVETGARTVACSRMSHANAGRPPKARMAVQAPEPAAPAAPVAAPAGITRQAAPPSAPWATWRAPVVYRKPRSTPPVGAGGKLF